MYKHKTIIRLDSIQFEFNNVILNFNSSQQPMRGDLDPPLVMFAKDNGINQSIVINSEVIKDYTIEKLLNLTENEIIEIIEKQRVLEGR